jgi:hypothetical protein
MPTSLLGIEDSRIWRTRKLERGLSRSLKLETL